MNAAEVGTLVLIAWSALLIISGSAWVLASQIGRLLDFLKTRTARQAQALGTRHLNGSLNRHGV